MTMSLSMKVNLGNYESADAFIALSNITDETTEAEMAALMTDQGRLAYGVLRQGLADRIKHIRATKGVA